MCAQRQHGRGAAHVLLHDQHGAFGLEIEPAGVEAHALADQRHLGIAGLAPAQFDQPRRAACLGGAADGVDQRKILLQQIVADDRTEFRAVLLGERAGGGLQLGRAHVVGRRVDQIAGERHALRRCAKGRRHRRHRAAPAAPPCPYLRLAVAREAVGAERERQRPEPRIVRRVGEAVGAGRQHAGQEARQEGVVVVLVAFQREQHAADTARRRQDQMPSGPRLEARGLDVGAGALVELGDDLGKCRRRHEPDRLRRLAAGHENGMHDVWSEVQSAWFSQLGF